MLKFIINSIKAAIEQHKVQSRLNILIGRKKKSDYIKLVLPKYYVSIIEIIELYGITDGNDLEKIIDFSKGVFPNIKIKMREHRVGLYGFIQEQIELEKKKNKARERSDSWCQNLFNPKNK